MVHPFQQYREKNPGQKKAHERVSRKATGGSVAASKPKALKTGGKADIKAPGLASGGRLDKYARGGKARPGKKSGHTKINILIAPNKGSDAAPGMPPPGAGATPPPKMPLPMPPPPGAMGPGGPGGPLPPMKRGGKIIGGADSGVGRLDLHGRHQKGGADSGVGRLDKVKMRK